MIENIIILQNSHYINRMLIAISSVKIVYWALIIFFKFHHISFFILWSCLVSVAFFRFGFFVGFFFLTRSGVALFSSINLTNPTNKDFFVKKKNRKRKWEINNAKIYVLFLLSLLAICTYWPVFWVIDYKTLKSEKWN